MKMIEENKEVKLTLLKGDIDRIIMALEYWEEGDDIIQDLKKYAGS